MIDFNKLLGLPILATEHGKTVDSFLIYVHWLMGALFVGWSAYFIYVLFRFRRSRHPKADYVGVRGHMTSYLEAAVALVEAVLLVGFAIPLWAKVVDDLPPEAESTVVRVTAQQFAWNARYPGADGKFGRQDMKLVNTDNKFGIDPADPAAKDDVTPPLNEVVVPVNKPAIVHLTSMDVIHSFKIYPFRVNQDAIPGMSIPVHFKPTREGKYQIVCAQLCGNSHYFMKGLFEVKSQAEYDAWLAEKSKSAGAPASFE